MFSLIIPSYNEEERIIPVINNFLDSFSDIEIIIVNNGSSDNTVNLINKTYKNNNKIKLLDFKQKLGKGGAIIKGMNIAKGDFIGFSDADQAVMPDDFKKLIKYLKFYDCAIGSRRVKGTDITIKQSLKRRISSKVFNIIVNLMFDLKIKDTQCGAKVFRKQIIKDILPKLKIKGFVFDIDVLYNLKKKSCKIKEVPISWKHQEGSKFSLTNAPKMFLSLLKLRFK